jgi:hypothetical protein
MKEGLTGEQLSLLSDSLVLLGVVHGRRIGRVGATGASLPALLSGPSATLGSSTHPLLVACASRAVSPESVPRLQSSSLSTPPEQAQSLAALAPNATSIHGVRSCKFHSNPIPIKLLFQDQEKRWKKKIICAGKEDGSC